MQNWPHLCMEETTIVNSDAAWSGSAPGGNSSAQCGKLSHSWHNNLLLCHNLQIFNCIRESSLHTAPHILTNGCTQYSQLHTHAPLTMHSPLTAACNHLPSLVQALAGQRRQCCGLQTSQSNSVANQPIKQRGPTSQSNSVAEPQASPT